MRREAGYHAPESEPPKPPLRKSPSVNPPGPQVVGPKIAQCVRPFQLTGPGSTGCFNPLPCPCRQKKADVHTRRCDALFPRKAILRIN